MCCGTDDYNYGAYGGEWQRSDMSYGRVGSVLEAQLEHYGESGVPLEGSIEEILEAPAEPMEELPAPSASTLEIPELDIDI